MHEHVTEKAIEAPISESGTKLCKRDQGRWIVEVRRAVEQLNYGEVVVSVHQGKVVQVQKTTKVRF